MVQRIARMRDAQHNKNTQQEEHLLKKKKKKDEKETSFQRWGETNLETLKNETFKRFSQFLVNREFERNLNEEKSKGRNRNGW